MRIISWNINGLRAVIEKGFLNFIEKYYPDILCLQEIKIDKSLLFPLQLDFNSQTNSLNGKNDLIDLSNYYEYWNPADKKGYSGTAIFSQKLPTNVTKEKNIPTSSSEGRIITAEYDKLFLINVYVPNGKDDLSRIPLRKNEFDPGLLDYAKSLQLNKPVIICGDFNVAHNEIDVYNPSQKKGHHGFTKEERTGFQNYLDAGFIDIYREQHPQKTDAYTWWSYLGNSRARNAGWRIDYFLISSSLQNNIEQVTILDEVYGSDHAPIMIDIKL